MNYVNSFSMRHDKDNELLHDAMQVVFAELSKLEEILTKPVETMTDLEKWSVFNYLFLCTARYHTDN